MLPSCFPPVEIAHAKIVRVEKNGALVLEDGRAAKLEGILLPAGPADRAPEIYAADAIARLVQLVKGENATLAAQPPKEDRYGRLRAEIVISSAGRRYWLQRVLLAQGLARVDIAPDRNECAPEFYAAEERARDSRQGLWADAVYAVRAPFPSANDADTFQIVRGTVRNVIASGGRISLEFGPDKRKDFAVVISPDDLRIFHEIGVDPYSYQGETVRVRGWIERDRRAEMEIGTPFDIEIVRSPILRNSLDAPD